MLALLVTWAVPLTNAMGGQGAAHQEGLYAVVVLAALVAGRCWRAPTRSAVPAAALALAAVLVCVLAPSGWSGADVAAGYGAAAASYLAARGYARTANRRAAILTAICLAGLYQFAQAFGPWVAAGNPGAELSGELGGHNAFAAFLLPGAVLGMGISAQFQLPWSLAGWIASPLCVAGIVFSTSRATLAVLIAALAGIFGVALVCRRGGIRVVGALLLAAVVVVLLPGPPVFSHRVSPFAATETRAATGETLDQNSAYRLAFWHDAAEVAWHRPLVGSGFNSLETASVPYVPPGHARSPNAHDGYLQALSDGGLLLGLPFLAAVALLAFSALRNLGLGLGSRRRGQPADVLAAATAVALLAAFAHSAVDADWTYPAILVEAALLGACVAPWQPAAGGFKRTAVSAWLCVVGVLLADIFALHQWQLDGKLAGQPPATLLARSSAVFGDYRPADWLLREVVNRRVTITRQQAEEALSLTRDAAKVNQYVALRRAEVRTIAGIASGVTEDLPGGTAPRLTPKKQIKAFP
ncbi:MAG TPA: O-antigen ligase family protein [Mycobacteriales bacterium]|nr:O-antigen ligase family protein [Mycobacteriales bacterium]